MKCVLGIDPASRRPWAWALLDERARVVETGHASGPDESLALAQRYRPVYVAIDSPLGFPLGLDCLEESCPCTPAINATGRACERELRALGIGCYWTTKHSIIKPMVYACAAFAQQLRNERIEPLEVYPYATKVLLWGRRMPRKGTPEGLAWLRDRVITVVPNARTRLKDANHDTYDAVLAALTGVLHLRGETGMLGILEEGLITIPRSLTRARVPVAASRPQTHGLFTFCYS
jgi:predicted nuclease with RNAse H fold